MRPLKTEKFFFFFFEITSQKASLTDKNDNQRYNALVIKQAIRQNHPKPPTLRQNHPNLPKTTQKKPKLLKTSQSYVKIAITI